MGPVRTCLGCRRRDSPNALLRVVARDGEVVADDPAVAPGRGAWVHPDRDCVEAAVKRKAFGRALRTAGQLDTSALTTRFAAPPQTTDHAS
jgi:uncharacterized protein